MLERHANLGYMALRPQADKLTVAGIPNFYVPIYSADLRTNANFVQDNPIAGNKFGRFQTVRGLRGHTGSIQVMGEPNTLAHVMNMFLTAGSQSGADPFTMPFTLSGASDPAFYTADISYVTHVVRYVGLAVSSFEMAFEENELRPNLGVSCLKAWDGREIASVNLQVITFSQEYDRAPTHGLFTGDTLQIYDVSEGDYIDVTVDSVDSDTDITVTGTITPGTTGDFVTIKPQSSVSFSILDPFLWANTEFRFGADAATALTATHTPLEQDTSLSLQHEFEDGEGAKRSGSFDPASLVRMQGMYEFTPKKYFDTPSDLLKYNEMTKDACVVRSFVYDYDSGNTYELRITLNNMTYMNPIPNPSTEEVLYSEIEMSGNFDQSDGQGMGVTTISAVDLS